MAQLEDCRRAALNIEEASLLPALSRNGMGSAALRAALRQSEEIGRLRTGAFVTGQFLGRTLQSGGTATPTYRFPGSRAALHQVMRGINMPDSTRQVSRNDAGLAAQSTDAENERLTEENAEGQNAAESAEEKGLNWLNTLCGPDNRPKEQENDGESPWLGW